MIQDTIKHHLTDALLMAYSAGTLPEAFSLAVAAHISMCDECRARLGAFDTVGGTLMENCDAAVMSADSLDATLAMIDLAEARPAERDVPLGGGVLPAPVRAYVGGDLDSVRWRPVGMGVKQAILPTKGDATARRKARQVLQEARARKKSGVVRAPIADEMLAEMEDQHRERLEEYRRRKEALEATRAALSTKKGGGSKV